MKLKTALIYVKDLDRMAAFYNRVLGLKPVNETRTDTWVEFEAGGARLALHAIPTAIAELIEIASPPEAREDMPIKLIFAVEDLDAECDSLSSSGVPLTRRPWGAADGLDPEGNVFQIST